jgi:ethanolamine utilization protein EutA (predicted chaperonin)
VRIAAPARCILADCGLRLEVGDAVTLDALRRFTDRMADLTVELIEGDGLAAGAAILSHRRRRRCRGAARC